jgi:hypothetical protein
MLVPPPQFIFLGRYLASGGKDRSLLIHECAHLDPDPVTSRHQHSFTPRAFLKNAHKRIIWDLTSALLSSSLPSPPVTPPFPPSSDGLVTLMNSWRQLLEMGLSKSGNCNSQRRVLHKIPAS